MIADDVWKDSKLRLEVERSLGLEGLGICSDSPEINPSTTSTNIEVTKYMRVKVQVSGYIRQKSLKDTTPPR